MHALVSEVFCRGTPSVRRPELQWCLARHGRSNGCGVLEAIVLSQNLEKELLSNGNEETIEMRLHVGLRPSDFKSAFFSYLPFSNNNQLPLTTPKWGLSCLLLVEVL